MERTNARMPAAWRGAALRGLPAALLLAASACLGAQSDICENKTGTELIRCIEAAARDGGGEAAKRPAAPGVQPQPGRPNAVPAPAATRRPADDCSGREGAELRHCLAAGGRLAPQAATVKAPAPPGGGRPGEGCEGKSGEALRTCTEAAGRSPAKAEAGPPLFRCTGYTAADQPLCLHRNSAILACRNRKLYPDVEVCMRSQMTGAPEPKRADCAKVPARAKAHCEARNRVYAACSADKLGYFGCLEQKLGEDAVLPAAAPRPAAR